MLRLPQILIKIVPSLFRIQSPVQLRTVNDRQFATEFPMHQKYFTHFTKIIHFNEFSNHLIRIESILSDPIYEWVLGLFIFNGFLSCIVETSWTFQALKNWTECPNWESNLRIILYFALKKIETNKKIKEVSWKPQNIEGKR